MIQHRMSLQAELIEFANSNQPVINNPASDCREPLLEPTRADPILPNFENYREMGVIRNQ